MNRVVDVERPAGGVCEDVGAKGIEFAFVADDVIMVAALPDVAIERGPLIFLDTADVFIRGHRLEPVDDVEQGGMVCRGEAFER